MYAAPVNPDLITERVREMKDAGIITAASLTPQHVTTYIGKDKDLEAVLRIIKTNSHSRMRYVNPLPPTEAGELYMPAPVEVPVSGAVVFCLDVDRFEKF